MQEPTLIRGGLAPSALHKFGRFLGTRFNGVKGVDRILRLLHHPDKRQTSWIKTTGQAYPSGPKYHLESKWFTEWTVLFYGTQDQAIHRWMAEHAAADWVAFDIGANFGYYTCLLAGLCREVHAFEPVPWLAARMERNVALNGFRNVKINRAALSESEGTATLHLPDQSDANWGTSSLVHDSGAGREQIQVPALALDAYCHRNDLRVDFLKLDVEGAEHLVLRGGLATLRRWKPRLIIEHNHESAAEVIAILHGLNYEIRPVTGAAHAGRADATLSHDFLAIPRPA